jgi:hypothetical protein
MTTPPSDPNAGQYAPPPGQYAPPPGQYAPPPGQYAPPPGQYDPNAGQYDPNAGQFSQAAGPYGQAPGPAGGPQPGFAVAPNQMPGTSLAAVARKRGMRQIAIGAVIFVIGLVITVATYSSASSSPTGGSYVVAYGPMILGVVT